MSDVKMKKELGFFDLFCLASGTMISSGLFVLPGIAYAEVGPAVFVTYIIASLFIIPAMLSKAELSTAMPKAGGTYFFVDRSMGAGFGTMAGLAGWFSLSLKSAFALLGIGAFATLVYPDLTEWEVKLIAAGCTVFFAFLNAFSTKHAGSLQGVLVVGLLVLLGVYIFAGLPKMNVDHFKPFVMKDVGLLQIASTAGLIFISYGGLTKVASVAEEVKNPAKNIPYSMIVSFLVVSVVYFLAVLVTVGVLGGKLINEDGQATLTPISDGAYIILGPVGMIFLSVAAMLAFISTANAGIMAASRAPLAMGRDQLMPDFFTRLNSRFHTPVNAIILTTIFMVAVILLLDIKDLVKTASTIMIILFILVNLAVIIMRESKVPNYRPKFKSPFYPWMQIIGIISYVFLLVDMGMNMKLLPILITAIFLVVGLVWYWLYGRINSNRVSALLLLVRRITAAELNSDLLNSELKEILLERDEIIEDRFDTFVKKAEVLDVDEKINIEELFEKICDVLSNDVALSKKELVELFKKRENDSSTVLAPGLAVPHVILPGEKKFQLMLVRCQAGVSFPQSDEPVHTLFVLVGSMDQRNFHLKALMSIAQIVQSEGFMDAWQKAQNSEELRDLILLSDRVRE